MDQPDDCAHACQRQLRIRFFAGKAVEVGWPLWGRRIEIKLNSLLSHEAFMRVPVGDCFDVAVTLIVNHYNHPCLRAAETTLGLSSLEYRILNTVLVLVSSSSPEDDATIERYRDHAQHIPHQGYCIKDIALIIVGSADSLNQTTGAAWRARTSSVQASRQRGILLRPLDSDGGADMKGEYWQSTPT
jgi:hypothetical protein